MKKRKIGIVVIGMVILALMSGCVDNPGNVTYISTVTGHSLVLFEDKTFIYQQPDSTYMGGTYRWSNNHLYLTFNAFGEVFDFKKINNTHVKGGDGTIWIKK